MKKILASASVFVSLIATSGYSMAGFDAMQWAVHVSDFYSGLKDPGGSGFKSITYPINVISGPAERKFFYSQYAYFKDKTSKDESFYIGIQPQGNGRALVLFSYFGLGGRIIDTVNCSMGADGGSGVTCNQVIIPFRFGVIYNFTASLSGDNPTENIWVGYVEDTSTGVKTRIGSWATPKTLGLLSETTIGFIEDYVGIKSCSEVPATSAYFGPVRAVDSNKKINFGSIGEPYDNNNVCRDKLKVSTEVHSDGGRTISQEKGGD